jgi:hypothetical protein
LGRRQVQERRGGELAKSIGFSAALMLSPSKHHRICAGLADAGPFDELRVSAVMMSREAAKRVVMGAGFTLRSLLFSAPLRETRFALAGEGVTPIQAAVSAAR